MNWKVFSSIARRKEPETCHVGISSMAAYINLNIAKKTLKISPPPSPPPSEGEG